MTTSDKHAKIISDLEKIQSEVTDRPPYVFEREGQLFVSSEEGDEFSDYYGEYYAPMYIDERLETIAEKNGGYWEWENAGTIVFVDDSFAKGGMMQGYNDRLDESLGNRNSVEPLMMQSYKDRRDESKGMEKSMGRRPYSSVGTMDKMAKGGEVFDLRDRLIDLGDEDFVEFEEKQSNDDNTLYSTFKERLEDYHGETVFAKGGKIGFDGLARKVAKRYEGKSVPKKFQKEYGKTYDKKEAMEVGKKVAGKVYREQQSMAKGGKTQGYNDKLDESLGNRNSVEPIMKQSFKDRRNESEAMEKKGGKRKYASVKTMDKGSRKKRKTPMTLAKEIRKEGEKWQDAVKRASAMLKKK